MDSRLQIISGTYRGRKLYLPDGARPTQNRARIAVFNMLMPMIDWNTPRVVWDAFSGSGAFGIEILSRIENSKAIFTDTSSNSIATIRRNLNELNVQNRITVVQSDAIAAISRFGAISDLVFVDPPYADSDIGAAFVRRIMNILKPGAILIWEQDSDKFVLPDTNLCQIIRDKQYGRARFLILKKL